MRNLGACYQYGIGCEIDYQEAYDYYSSSEHLGNFQGIY